MKQSIIQKSKTLCGILVLTGLMAAGTAVRAGVQLPAVFSNNMVLQQQSEVPVWGWASAAGTVKIVASWSPADTVKVKATSGGTWMATVRTVKAGGPYSLRIFTSDADFKEFHNVMLGEVWLCSGQSNMQWSVNHGILNGNEEAEAANRPDIRIFHIPMRTAETPQNNCDASWEQCTPEVMRNSSAVAYFFARRLQDALNVPVGIVVAAWGGTPYEVWTKSELIESNPLLKASSDALNKNPWWPSEPGTCYNQMIHPIVPYSIAGAVWYQGEANIDRYATYGLGLQTMINCWRSEFKKEFPFYLVQIAPYTYNSTGNAAAQLREQQELVTKLVPKTGMAVISDRVNNVKNIHPADKQTVGLRLGDLALAEIYGQPLNDCKSPVFLSLKVEKNKAIITFEHAQSGLKCSGDKIEGLKIADADGNYVDANGIIKGNELIVSSPEVKAPVSVTYCFDDASTGNLFSGAGLPVAPFRSNRTVSFY
ncbi:MAG: sialate O-acetylesterase [Prevotellaceae bacterium]|jgi:sialate O-acetylesterase|nr:sialate O-acetylesterase [Prevotellaceae bacterium]